MTGQRNRPRVGSLVLDGHPEVPGRSLLSRSPDSILQDYWVVGRGGRREGLEDSDRQKDFTSLHTIIACVQTGLSVT